MYIRMYISVLIKYINRCTYGQLHVIWEPPTKVCLQVTEPLSRPVSRAPRDRPVARSKSIPTLPRDSRRDLSTTPRIHTESFQESFIQECVLNYTKTRRDLK